MTTRDAYLKNWKPYPLRPSAAVIVRVVGREPGLLWVEEPWSLSASKKGRFGARRFSLRMTDEEWSHWVVEGDWLSIPKNLKRKWTSQDLTLLAPSQGDYPQTRVYPDVLFAWSELQIRLRAFFQRRRFIEVNTPFLVSCPGTEVHIEPFSTEFVSGHHRERFYLPTSPELHLKKTLMLGIDRVFEIKTCFRNGEVTPIHQPEFQMLEWYRMGEPLQQIARDLEDLVRFLWKSFAPLRRAKNSPLPKFKMLTMAEVFRQHLQFHLTPGTSLGELQTLASQLGLSSKGYDWNDLFHLIFVEKVESQFDPKGPLLIKDFPPSQAAYARLTPEGWADRFELYWQGMEIGNAFHEINDPRLQEERMKLDLQAKCELGRSEVLLDQEFLEMMKQGMPPCSGIAVGMDRLFMACMGLKELKEIRLFPLKR